MRGWFSGGLKRGISGGACRVGLVEIGVGL